MSIEESSPSGGGSWPERVELDPPRARTSFRVRYAETDQMGVVYYANYLVWFEVMRGDFMRAVGLPYDLLEAQGTYLPIVEAQVRYRAPARYGDAVTVVAWISRLQSRRIVFQYRVERDDDCLATGSTEHVPIDPDGRPRAFSLELCDALSLFIVREGGPETRASRTS